MIGKLIFILMLCAFPMAVLATVFAVVWLFYRRALVWKFYLGIWAFIVLAFLFSYSIAYFTPPKDKIYQYTKIRLSEDTRILKKHYDLDSIDFGCAFEIQLSQQDLDNLKNFFTFHSTNDCAIDRLPKSWATENHKELVRLYKNDGNVWIYFDYIPSLRLAWLVVQTT
jgi:hypothetical protein